MGRDSRINPFGRDNPLPAPSVVRDRYGRILKQGDKVFLTMPVLIQPYTIESITEVTNPNIPNGHHLMEVMVRSRLRFHADKDQPAEAFVRFLAASELDERATPPAAPAPPPDTPPDAPGESFLEMQQRLRAEHASALDQFPSEEPTPKEEIQ